MPELRGTPSIRFGEFVTLAAATMSTQAIAIDAMLPAFPVIVDALRIADANRGQWIVTAYMTGLGIGQMFWGLISDRFGRRRVLLSGLGVYVVAALVSGLSSNFHLLLGARAVHGFAAASVTVVRSAIRDLYSGRDMARVMSLTFMVFLTVPVLAPSIGQLILLIASWRFIFVVFALFASAVALWVYARLPETLHPEYRLKLDPKHISASVRKVLGERAAMGYTLAMMVMFGSLIAYVGMVQQIFSDIFHRPTWMPSMFALCAVFMGFGAFWNSRMVHRLGMRPISHTALLSFIGVAALHTVIAMSGLERLWTFVTFQAATMVCFSLALSNFGAMAMEPVGSVAGVAASLQGFISTFTGAFVGAFIGKQFNGSTVPLAFGSLLCGLAALGFVLFAERGRLFAAHHPSPGPQAVGAQAEGIEFH